MGESLRFLKPYLRGLPIIMILMIVAYLMASRYLKYVTPMYESTAKLRLADIGEGVPNSNLFKDLDVFASANKINAEIEVLKSQTILEKTLKNIDFQTQIFRVGKIKKVELYDDAPFVIKTFNTTKTIEDKRFQLCILKNQTFIIEDNAGRKVFGKIGDTLILNHSKLMLELNQSLFEHKKQLRLVDNYEFIINSKEKVLKEILQNLDIMAVDKDVPVIRISYKSAHPQKAAALPNALAKTYIEDYIESKYSAANTAVNFLGNQIKGIQTKLSQSEQQILNYRNQRGITNLRQETETDLRTISQLKIQQTNLKMSLDAVKDLERYVQNGKGNFLELAPNFEAFTDLLSTEIIKKVKNLQAEKRDLLMTYTSSDERVQVIDAKINDLTSYMIESITNTRKNLESKYENLNRDIVSASSELIPVPEKEYMMTIYNREFNIYQNTYNFLNEKKIEAEIAQAAKIAFHRVITPAMVSKEPVSPNKTIIKIVSALLGMMGAILLIFFIHALKARINDKETIEENSMIPVVATVPKLKKQEIEDYFLKTTTQLEIKGLLKNNGITCLTGFSLSEGASFIAKNLLSSCALQERKALLIDFHNSNSSENIEYISENVGILSVNTQKIKRLSNQKFQEFIGSHKDQFEQVFILNENIGGQLTLPTMALANLNLVCVDTRLSPAKNILKVDLMKEEYQLPNIYFMLNRHGYNPSLLRDIKSLFRKTVELWTSFKNKMTYASKIISK
ncbi:MAG: Wzz/FepE/Etk N-terminal domain-containing protein [Raineya sp.]|nr:Wzz/FepE/Etk N-terminal domain-containing protein [Raineya sp.]